MQFQKVLFVFFVVIISMKTKAQVLELGNVSIAELEEKAHSKDSSATAAVLFQKGTVNYVFEYRQRFKTITEVKTRIKIYKKEGYSFANQNIMYYSGERAYTQIAFTNAITYNLVNGKIEKTNLKEEGKFEQNVNKYLTQKKITMPNVKVGSIIEFQYTIIEEGIGTPTKWNFQNGIPVNYSEYITCIPEYFIFKKNQKGFLFPKATTERKLDRPDYAEIKTTYLAENMPAMKEELYVNNIENFTSSISHELSAVNFPGIYYKLYSTDWETVSKSICKLDDFNIELNKKGYFEEDIKAVLIGMNTRDEKIGAIFNYVKSKVKWDTTNGFLCHYGVRSAYKSGIGNAAEINLMLTAMLRYAQIEANPVLLSTRSNGLVLFPSLNAFNYVISAVEIENDLILLDATETNATPNILPLRDLNWEGRLIREKGNSSVAVDLNPKLLSRELINMNYVIDAFGLIKGKLRRQISNHLALKFRQDISLTNKEGYFQTLENNNNNIEINDYVRENDLELLNPIVESYSFKDNKSIEILNGKIYLAPLLFLTTIENPFKQEVRAYPVDFGYPIEKKFNINIEIPDGYVVESLPSPVNVTANEISGVFKYVIGAVDNKIQIQVTMANAIAIIPADFYEVLKEFYQMMVEKQNTKIILIKKQ